MKKICILFAALFCLFAVIGCGDFNEEHIYYYNINFNTQGGSSVSSIRNQVAGTKITLPSPAARSGYIFSGWYSSDGKTKYGDGGGSYTITSSVTMYAVWIASYTITFNPNGGAAVSSMTGVSGTKVTLPTATRSGCTFVGWYSIGADGSWGSGLKHGDGGGSYTITGNITMYARWNATITFDSQGGESVSPITETLGTSITLPTPTRDGYTFDGWYSSASGGTKYGNNVGSYTLNGGVTMYARWVIAITFDTQGGSIVSPIMQGLGTSVTLPVPTRANYTFDGWYSSAEGGEKYDSPYTFTSSVTMYAHWTPINYTITFDSQGGESVSPITQLSGSSVTLPTATREGYTFNGWYNSAEGGTKYNSPYTLAGNVTIFARWTAANYTLAYDTQGGNNISSVTRAYGTQITLPTPTRANYTFSGWYSSASGGDKYDSPHTLKGDVTMYARWVITYTITFNVQGGLGLSALTDTAGSIVELPTPTRADYTFVGWYNSSSDGIKYESPHTLAGNATMYARWVGVDYTITFDTQGGSSVSSITAAYNSSVNLPAAPVREGYTFAGWYGSAGGARYGGGSSYTITGNVTMYADWTPVNYTITFDYQGGSSVSSITAAYNSSVNLPVTTRLGYTFNGWFSASSGGDKYDSPHTLKGDVTMYAQWTIIDLGTNGSGNDGDEMTINGIALVLVKAGTFTMGSPTSESGRDSDEAEHQVTLTNDYWISKYPITQAQYRAVTGNSPSYFSGRDNNPVEYVTWTAANNFAQSVSGRLPTEAEWEFAARGGNKSEGYIYSGGNNLDSVGWYWNNIPSTSSGNSGYGTQPVGQKKPNELGIYDMSGNVWEWCNDWYGTYPTGAVTNPTGPSSGTYRIVRGGSWYYYAQVFRVAYRNGNGPSSDDSYSIGVRVVFPRE